jgi:hypothetical protein
VTLGKKYICAHKYADLSKLVWYINLCAVFNLYIHNLPVFQKRGCYFIKDVSVPGSDTVWTGKEVDTNVSEKPNCLHLKATAMRT